MAMELKAWVNSLEEFVNVDKIDEQNCCMFDGTVWYPLDDVHFVYVGNGDVIPASRLF